MRRTSRSLALSLTALSEVLVLLLVLGADVVMLVLNALVLMKLLNIALAVADFSQNFIGVFPPCGCGCNHLGRCSLKGHGLGDVVRLPAPGVV